MTGKSLPYRAVSDSTAWPAVAAPGGGTTGGTVAIDGGTIVGCVNGAGRLGSDPGPEGGARFIAGPEGASGTEAGGTGGGRSENIWAETDAGMKQASTEASTSAGKSRPARPSPPIPSPHEVMGMLFTENAANSSLRGGLRAWPSGNPHKDAMLIQRSWPQSQCC